MSIFNQMTAKHGGASYGVVPGNGHPKADDKIMNVGSGHVVPYENVDKAKALVAEMGYDPNVNVSMNQGGGHGADIRISSKEYFLNEQQVAELKARGIDPEHLSPNSPYNQRVNGGTTPENRAGEFSEGGGLSMYELMMNNNNQYPSYQDAGSTDSVQPDAFRNSQKFTDKSVYDDQGNKIGVRNEVSTAPNAEASRVYNIPEGYDPQETLSSMAPDLVRNEEWTGTENDNTGLPQFDLPGYDSNVAPSADSNIVMKPRTFQDIYNSEKKPSAQLPADNNIPGWQEAVMAMTPKKEGLTPDEQHLEDLLAKNDKNANQEIGANLAMLGWNASKGRHPGVQPNMVVNREMVRDYQGMKTKATADLERGERRNAKAIREMGDPSKIVGLHANTVAGINQISQSLWDMQGQDSMANISAANQVRAQYEQDMQRYNMNEGIASADFQEKKGANMAANTAQIFRVKESQFNNEAQLKGHKVNNQMDDLDAKYNTLNTAKVGKARGFVSRQDYYKMTQEERDQLHKL